jgi:hypothetical protein
MTAEKIRENRLRRMATRQGLHLVKARWRDPRALGYGGYMIVDDSPNALVADCTNLDQVEAWLTDDEARERRAKEIETPTPAGATVSAPQRDGPYAAPRPRHR